MIITDEAQLRLPCTDATENEVGEIIDLLERELEHSARMGRPGIGLAAPQCGIRKNVAIIRLNEANSINLINARITQAYDQGIFRDEGCLSFPGRVEETLRYQEIYITGNLVRPEEFVATGLLAVVCQHELDHLNGVLLPDIAIKKDPPKKIKVRPNDPCFCGAMNPLTKQPIKFKRCHGERE
jgi:peptide deformylase